MADPTVCGGSGMEVGGDPANNGGGLGFGLFGFFLSNLFSRVTSIGDLHVKIQFLQIFWRMQLLAICKITFGRM